MDWLLVVLLPQSFSSTLEILLHIQSVLLQKTLMQPEDGGLIDIYSILKAADEDMMVYSWQYGYQSSWTEVTQVQKHR